MTLFEEQDNLTSLRGGPKMYMFALNIDMEFQLSAYLKRSILAKSWSSQPLYPVCDVFDKTSIYVKMSLR